MKRIRTPLSILLTIAILITSAVTISAWVVEKEMWYSAWAGSAEEIGAAVTMTPGSDDTDRYISWYADTNSGEVSVVNARGEEIGPFEAQAVATPQGDYRLVAYVTGLDPQGAYHYTCRSGDWTSDTYAIAPAGDDSFTAMYVTDIHVGLDENNPDEIRNDSYYFNETLIAAYNKAVSKGTPLSLILSGGDQATEGTRPEYEGIVANDFVKSIPFAPCIGNHDTKSVDYKYFNAIQAGTVDMAVNSYVGTDYYFVRGNVLFMVMDSNNLSMGDHEKLIKKATKEYPDVKWRVGVFHHDLYSARIPHRESENQWLRLMWAPLADKYGFDLFLLGHSHYYTISNVMYNNQTVADLENNATLTDPEGTIYLVSGSINNPRGEDDEIGLSDNIGHDVLTREKIYNLLDFSDDSIVINSYTVESDSCIGTVTIEKTTNEGGHSYTTPAAWYYPLVKVISGIAAVFYNIGNYYDNTTELGFDIPLLEGLFG